LLDALCSLGVLVAFQHREEQLRSRYRFAKGEPFWLDLGMLRGLGFELLRLDHELSKGVSKIWMGHSVGRP
jgi:hypothetical protein